MNKPFKDPSELEESESETLPTTTFTDHCSHCAALRAELAAAREEADRWKQQWQTVTDERAASFARIGRAVGGISLTEYQPEVDLEIEAAVKATREDTERFWWAVDHPHEFEEIIDGIRFGPDKDQNYALVRAAIDSARKGPQ